MKSFKYIITIIFFLASNFAFSDYWQKLENLPTGYQNNEWLDVFFLPSNPSYGWACGFNGMVIRTTNAGASWSGSSISGAYHLEHIQFLNTTLGYASGVQGIFKSTDGGSTWTNLTNDQMRLHGLWGCSFINANTGVALGGGCLDSLQRFWKTTDGGENWTLFEGNEPNSGLTDAVLYSSGGGYAVSSGKIWQTTDAGSTWSVIANTETSNNNNRWHEELSIMGSSFLVPYSGNECGGGSIAGGMYFSTNSGSSWNKSNASNRMFGAFLTGETSGWVCGHGGELYYTSNSGRNWERRNCGINGANLDDIWFVNPNTGWAVGNGVFKLSRDTVKFSLDTLLFKNSCFPSGGFDTLKLYNKSSNAASVRFSLNGAFTNEIKLVSHAQNTNINIPACDSILIILQTVPNSAGLKQAVLVANVNNNYVISCIINAFASNSTAKPENGVLEINPAFCSLPIYADMKWTAQFNNESIEKFQKMIVNNAIDVKFTDNTKIGENGLLVPFTAKTIDTGWTSADFKVFLKPCDRDTIVKVRAYGVSPIINASDTTISINCIPDELIKIKIPISNTGNAALQIPSVIIDDPDFEFVSFTNSKEKVSNILQNQTDTIEINFKTSKLINTKRANVTLLNNDSTKVRGNRNPLTFSVTLVNNYPVLSSDKISIFHNDICLGDSVSNSFIVRNKGVGVGNYIFEIFAENCDYTISPNPETLTLGSKQEIAFNYSIKPHSAENALLIIKFKNNRCEDSLEVIIRSTSAISNVIYSPVNIDTNIITGRELSIPLNISLSGNMSLNLINCELKYDEIDFDYSPKNITIEAGAANLLNLSFTCNEDKIYYDTLSLHFDGICPKIVQIPIKIVSSSARIELSSYEIDFPPIFCDDSQKLEETITIINTGTIADTVISIELSDMLNFSAEHKPLPLIIQPGISEDLKIIYTPVDTGKVTAIVQVKSIRMNELSLELDLNSYFAKSEIEINKNKIDFGDLAECHLIKRDTIIIINKGNLLDTIDVISVLTGEGLHINTEMLVLAAFSSDSIFIEINPAEITKRNENIEVIRLNSRVCVKSLFTEISFTMHNKSIALKPNEINYYELWSEKKVLDSFKIYNNSSYEISIDSMLIIRDSFNIEFAQFSLPKALKQLDSITVDFEFTPLDTGNYSAEFVLYFNMLGCLDSQKIVMTGYVPEEIYYTRFSIDNYESEPGKSFDFAVKNDSVFTEIEPDSIYFRIACDKYLISPKKVRVLNKDVDFNSSADNISFVIEKDAAKDILKKTGEIASIQALALISSPDSCSIYFDEVKVYHKKKIIALHKDGFFKLINYCKPIGEISKFQSTAIDLNAELANNVLSLNYNSKARRELELSIYDNQGKSVFADIYTINSSGVIEKDLRDLPSGIYFIEVSSWGKSLIKKKMIVKK